MGTCQIRRRRQWSVASLASAWTYQKTESRRRTSYFASSNNRPSDNPKRVDRPTQGFTGALMFAGHKLRRVTLYYNCSSSFSVERCDTARGRRRRVATSIFREEESPHPFVAPDALALAAAAAARLLIHPRCIIKEIAEGSPLAENLSFGWTQGWQAVRSEPVTRFQNLHRVQSWDRGSPKLEPQFFYVQT